MNGFVKGLAVTAFGLVTSVATAVVLALVEKYTELSLYGFFLWIVIPVGAIGAGFLAASGYYLGCRLLHVRPALLLALQMLVVAGATHVLIYWLEYRDMVLPDGRQVSDLIDFWSYLKLSLTSMHYQLGHSSSTDTGEVGKLGYWIGAVQFLGFLAGGLIVFVVLRSKPWCARCERYLRGITKVEQRHEDAQTAVARAEALFTIPVGSGEFALACAPIAAAGKPAPGAGRLTIHLLECAECKVQWLRTELHGWNGREWKDLDGGRLVELPRGVDVRGAFGVERPGMPPRAAVG